MPGKVPPLVDEHATAGRRSQRSRSGHAVSIEFSHPLINRKIQDAVDLARRGLTREAHKLFSDAALLAEHENTPEDAALVYLTEIEQLARILTQEELRLSYLKAARLLELSTNRALHDRLLQCADLILLNSDEQPELIIFVAGDEHTTQVVRQARELALMPSPVLITGPLGAGKETLARAIHHWSGRPGEVTVLDCGSVQQDELILALRAASTLVLKNVNLLPPATHPALVNRIITTGPPPSRIIATSTVGLELDPNLLPSMPRQLVSYFRTIQLTLDSLAARPKDLALLVHRFLEDANLRYNKVLQIQPEAIPLFSSLQYPENAATLRLLIERTVATAERHALITTDDLETAAVRESLPLSLADPWADLDLNQELILRERRLIRRALERAQGSISKAARLIAVSHQVLSHRIRARHPDLETVRNEPGTRTRRRNGTPPSE